MKVFHINLGYTKGMSGGDVCTLEVVRHLITRRVSNVMVCTESTRKMYESLGLINGVFLEYITLPDFWDGRDGLSLLWAYVRRTVRMLKMISKLPVTANDSLFCCSGFFPNSIPFARLARRYRQTKLFYWLHMPEPKLWFGFEGTYTGRRTFPDLKRIRYILDMRFYRRLMRSRGVVIICNPIYEDSLQRSIPANQIYTIRHFSGAELPESLLNEPLEKKYDFSWIGRFHEQKGLFELLDVTQRIKNENSQVRVVVIGGGSQKMEQRFMREVEKRGLVENIVWQGIVVGVDKYRLLRQSKAFLMTSYFESFGIVNLEAMKCGLPVVAYDLPVFDVFERGLIRVPILDNASMADVAMRLLQDDPYYLKHQKEASDYSEEFSWKKTGNEIYQLLLDSGFCGSDA